MLCTYCINYHDILHGLIASDLSHSSIKWSYIRVRNDISKAHADNVSAYIREEVKAGRLIGPVERELAPTCHINPLGIISKPHQLGHWRMIVDSSSPRGHSINEGISATQCSLHYASVDAVVKIARSIGHHTDMVKFDLSNPYRFASINPGDQHLLGIRWQDKVYLDSALPFGLRSAPKLFSVVADALAWAMFARGVSYLLHYLDDFMALGPAGSSECQIALDTALAVCEELGVPVAHHKTKGPTQALPFLGIVRLGQLRLPA